jgi:hypothetical protein
VDERAVEVVQIDPVTNGGISASLRALEMANAAGLKASSHYTDELSAHLLCAAQAPVYLEKHAFALDRYLEAPQEVRNGRVRRPRCRGPGCGSRSRRSRLIAANLRTMARLHDDEVAHYRREGWVVPRFRLPAARVAAWWTRSRPCCGKTRACAGEAGFRAHRGTHGDNGEGVRGSRAFLDLARDPEIVELVSGVLGEDVILWGCHVFCKPAVEGYETPWHQDGHYWPIRPLATCTAWVALEPSTVENGCLRVIPRSHAERRLHDHLHEDRTDLTLQPAHGRRRRVRRGGHRAASRARCRCTTCT